jgi:hypothetical protein
VKEEGCLTHFIESRERGEVNWHSLKHTTNDSIEITNLKPDTIFEFRICAVSEGEDESPFSEPISVLVT